MAQDGPLSQAAAGFGGLLWGLLIVRAGHPWPFLVAIARQGGCVALSVWRLPRWRSRLPA